MNAIDIIPFLFAIFSVGLGAFIFGFTLMREEFGVFEVFSLFCSAGLVVVGSLLYTAL